ATGRYSYSFDGNSQTVVAANPNSKTITYAYDAVGNRAHMDAPDAGRFTYVYDATNQISLLHNAFDERTSFAYDEAGRRTLKKLANGTRASYTYDAASNLTNLHNLKSDNSVISSFDYRYNDINNRMAVGEANGDRVTWTYDNTSQVTSEHRSGAHAYRNTFVYDSVGNRLILNEDGNRTTTVFDAVNQIEHSEAAAGRTTYTFDADGNQQVVEQPDNYRTTNVWDYENRLMNVVLPDGTRSTITYQPNNLRVTSDGGTSTKTWLWDDQNYLSQTDGDTLVFTNTPDQYGDLVSQHDGTTTNFYHFDARGDSRQLTNSLELITDSRLFDAWGNLVALTGNTQLPFQFIGASAYISNEGTTFFYARNRYYRAAEARWLSRDPAVILWSLQHYSYVSNSPIQRVDPTGKDEQLPFRPPIDLNTFNQYPFTLPIRPKPLPLSLMWKNIDLNDAFGRQCCGKDLCTVKLYVTKPCRSAAAQIASNLAALQPPGVGLQTGHTWIAGTCGTSKIAVGLFPLTGQIDGSVQTQPQVDHEVHATHVEEFDACPASFEALSEEINRFERLIRRRQAWYSLVDPIRGNNIFNCTSWACEMLERSGATLGPNLYFDPFELANRPEMKELKKCITDNAAT
ncbi:MAG: RHS repeat-associated core domain-containing protein, partial [Parvibaculaceae bacterium]